jgi:Mlo family
MAGGGGGGATSPIRELDQTPTWAVASVCMTIILISIIIEKALHHLGAVICIVILYMIIFFITQFIPFYTQLS